MAINKTKTNKITNEETQQAIKKAREGENMEKVTFDKLNKVEIKKDEEDLDMEIEPILPGDPDYEIVKNAYENYKKHPEDYIDFDEINWD